MPRPKDQPLDQCAEGADRLPVDDEAPAAAGVDRGRAGLGDHQRSSRPIGLDTDAEGDFGISGVGEGGELGRSDVGPARIVDPRYDLRDPIRLERLGGPLGGVLLENPVVALSTTTARMASASWRLPTLWGRCTSQARNMIPEATPGITANRSVNWRSSTNALTVYRWSMRRRIVGDQRPPWNAALVAYRPARLVPKTASASRPGWLGLRGPGRRRPGSRRRTRAGAAGPQPRRHRRSRPGRRPCPRPCRRASGGAGPGPGAVAWRVGGNDWSLPQLNRCPARPDRRSGGCRPLSGERPAGGVPGPGCWPAAQSGRLLPARLSPAARPRARRSGSACPGTCAPAPPRSGPRSRAGSAARAAASTATAARQAGPRRHTGRPRRRCGPTGSWRWAVPCPSGRPAGGAGRPAV